MSDTSKKATAAKGKEGLNGAGGVQSSAAGIFDLALKNGLKFEDVEIPELGDGVKIRVRELTGFEREEFDRNIATVTTTSAGNSRGRRKKGRGDSGGASVEYHAEKIRLDLCFMCCINEDGDRLFTTGDEKKQLGDLSANILERMFKRIMILSGMAEEDEDDEDDEYGSDSERLDPIEVVRGES